MTVPGLAGGSLMKIIRTRMDIVALMALVVAAAYCVGTLLTFPGWRWPLLLVIAIVFSLAFGILLMRFGHGRQADERLMKILAWSSRNTLLTVVTLLAGLAILLDLGLLPWETVGIGETLKGGMIVIMVIFALWYAYFFVRGDAA